MLPRVVVLVRHGASEGNRANHRSEIGDNSLFTDEFRKRDPLTWELIPIGWKQVNAARRWIHASSISDFDALWHAEARRCAQSAYGLGYEISRWRAVPALRERDFGEIARLPHIERHWKYPEYYRGLRIDRYFTRPPGGESMDEFVQHVRTNLLAEIAKFGEQNPYGRILIVTHSGTMRALRVLWEGWTPQQYHERDTADSADDYIHNTHVRIYTRVNPENPKHILPYFGWVYWVCPWEPERSSGGWRRIRPLPALEPVLVRPGRKARRK